MQDQAFKETSEWTLSVETILWSLSVQGLPYPQLVHLLSSIFQLEISIGGSCSPLCLSPPSMVWSYLLLEQKKKQKQNKPSLRYGHELGKSPENSEGQGSLVHCSSWCCEESDIPWQLNTTTTYPGLIHSLLLVTGPIPSRTWLRDIGTVSFLSSSSFPGQLWMCKYLSKSHANVTAQVGGRWWSSWLQECRNVPCEVTLILREHLSQTTEYRVMTSVQTTHTLINVFACSCFICANVMSQTTG